MVLCGANNKGVGVKTKKRNKKNRLHGYRWAWELCFFLSVYSAWERVVDVCILDLYSLDISIPPLLGSVLQF